MPVTSVTTTKTTIFTGLCDAYLIACPDTVPAALMVFVNGESTASLTLPTGAGSRAELRRTGIERIFQIDVQADDPTVPVKLYHGVLTTQ